MSRPSAIALLVRSRKSLLADASERLPADATHLHSAADTLAGLLLDVRAGRIDTFELKEPTRMHVVISAD